ncbi:MAG: hypothetical protein K2X39_01590, partial [Silvanigrellaceae bacterium]|nr:hypothetical protein [Silvanigrellaceae bacterium]
GAVKQGYLVEETKVPGMAGLLEDAQPTGGESSAGNGILVVSETGKAMTFHNGKTVVVSEKYIEAENKQLEGVERIAEFEKERTEKKEALQKAAASKNDDQGIPEETEIKPIKKAERISLPYVKETALVGGYFATNIIENRGALGYTLLITPGIDRIVSKETVQKVTNEYNFAWTAAYFISSMALSYGGNQNADLFSYENLRNAGFNTAVYSAKNYFQPAKGNTPLPDPTKKSVFDFIGRYGPTMAQNAAWSILKTGTLIYITGATLGLAGVAAPALMSLGTDFLGFYSMYNQSTEEGEASKKTPERWDSYLAPYLLASISTMYYFSKIESFYLMGLDSPSQKIKLLQNLFGGLVTFSSTHQLSKLVYENFGKPIVDGALYYPGSFLSWGYRKIFGEKKKEGNEKSEQPPQPPSNKKDEL